MKSALIVVAIVIILVAGYASFAFLRGRPLTEVLHTKESVKMDEAPQQSETRVLLAGQASPLIDFKKSEYDAALASDKLVVLYFYANWCPVCKAETRDALYPAFNELADSAIVGFRVNFNDSDTDTNEVALAREFGVAYQHTKVFIKGGVRILKAPDSWTKERYLAEMRNAL